MANNSKNDILRLGSGNKAASLDPVAEAKAAAAAAAEATEAAEAASEAASEEVTAEPGADRGTEPPAGLTATTVAAASTETPGVEAASTAAEEVVLPHVEVTITRVSKPIAESSILSNSSRTKATSLQSVVVRTTGGSTREASPTDQVQEQEHVKSNSFDAVISAERKKGTANAVALIAFLDRYVQVMAPRKITSTADILRQQEGLLDALLTVIERAPAKEFARLWNIAILYVGEYKDACFHPAYCSRGARDWKTDPAKFTTLTNLINLLQVTANDPTSVTQIVDIGTMFGRGYSEDARQRMSAFYVK